MPGTRAIRTIPRYEGMQAATASTVGWMEGEGPECMFCGNPAPRYKPLHEGVTLNIAKVWWCPPCETTWEVRRP